MTEFSSVEICAGAGGTALGLEMAGFHPAALVEWEKWCCSTLQANRPEWKVFGPGADGDVCEFDGRPYHGVDLLSGGCPCTPFSGSGQQHGPDDERDLLPEAIRLVGEIEPRALLLENAAALLSDKFAEYRETVVLGPLRGLGYNTSWTTIDVADYGVPQRRVRSVLVANRPEYTYRPPEPGPAAATVGEAIGDLMAARGWPGAAAWARGANTVAPTLVGGSEKPAERSVHGRR
jgi:DNA (cytosine-5)-methyltransferase 1